MAAHKSGTSVDHEFGRIDAMISKAERIRLLALRPLTRGIGVDPALMIPVVDVVFQGYDFRPAYRLLLFELCEQRICRRAARATFRCEQFQQHWNAHTRGGSDTRRLFGEF